MRESNSQGLSATGLQPAAVAIPTLRMDMTPVNQPVKVQALYRLSYVTQGRRQESNLQPLCLKK